MIQHILKFNYFCIRNIVKVYKFIDKKTATIEIILWLLAIIVLAYRIYSMIKLL